MNVNQNLVIHLVFFLFLLLIIVPYFYLLLRLLSLPRPPPLPLLRSLPLLPSSPSSSHPSSFHSRCGSIKLVVFLLLINGSMNRFKGRSSCTYLRLNLNILRLSKSLENLRVRVRLQTVSP